MIYFVVNVYIDQVHGKGEYNDYIKAVKPIVEKYGGRYIIRSEKILFGDENKPDRFILIQFNSKWQLEQCFKSSEYLKIVDKRKNYVKSKAFIVEG